MTFEEAITKFEASLDIEIPIESGTYNKFCPKCFYRNGHPIQWCYRCGTEMLVYTEQSVRPSWREFIKRATTQDEKDQRLVEFINAFGAPYSAYKDHWIKFKFVWWKDSKKCTTPKFITALKPRL